MRQELADALLNGADRSVPPRICMPIFSSFSRNVHRCATYEAQDVLASCDDVDVIRVETTKAFPVVENLLYRLIFHDRSRKLVSVNPALRPVRLRRDYDLFVVVCPLLRDAWYAAAIEGWRDHCRTSVCWIDELWAADVPRVEYWLPVLSKFDHVIVSIAGTGPVLSRALGRPCHEMYGGVDAIRFSPYPNSAPRVIDVYSIGRRREAIHQRLLASSREGMFYVYDTTIDPGRSEALDYAEHRHLYANLAKRSRFFMVAPSKVDAPGETDGQIGFGLRYFEGAAAGAVLLGDAPQCEGFRRHFDWPDAVIELQPDGSDTLEIMSKLSADAERLADIGRRNAEEVLRRHDWVYRWKEILRMAGLKPAPAMETRQRRLSQLAQLAADNGR